jgi:hypothetical protein
LRLLPPLLLVGEGEARQALKETELAANASRTAVRVKELTNVFDKYPRAKALLYLLVLRKK